jgi:hypothetical protein
MEVAAQHGEGPFVKLIRPQEAREGDVLIVRKGAHVAYVEKAEDDGSLHVAAGVPGGKVARTVYRPPGTVYKAIRVREPSRTAIGLGFSPWQLQPGAGHEGPARPGRQRRRREAHRRTAPRGRLQITEATLLLWRHEEHRERYERFARELAYERESRTVGVLQETIVETSRIKRDC